jgi:hypothetical protein
MKVLSDEIATLRARLDNLEVSTVRYMPDASRPGTQRLFVTAPSGDQNLEMARALMRHKSE